MSAHIRCDKWIPRERSIAGKVGRCMERLTSHDVILVFLSCLLVVLMLVSLSVPVIPASPSRRLYFVEEYRVTVMSFKSTSSLQAKPVIKVQSKAYSSPSSHTSNRMAPENESIMRGNLQRPMGLWYRVWGKCTEQEYGRTSDDP